MYVLNYTCMFLYIRPNPRFNTSSEDDEPVVCPSETALPTPPIKLNSTAASPRPERPSKSALHTPIRLNTTVASPHPECPSRSALHTPIRLNTTVASPRPDRLTEPQPTCNNQSKTVNVLRGKLTIFIVMNMFRHI